jgi:8-oxo-dGTP pyrophosphatase MutT (NUDIX family)
MRPILRAAGGIAAPARECKGVDRVSFPTHRQDGINSCKYVGFYAIVSIRHLRQGALAGIAASEQQIGTPVTDPMRVKTKSHDLRIQFGALPFKFDAAGGLLILLVTSRPVADRWTIPKGQPIKGLRGAEVAEREAFEEAGVSGHVIGSRSLGHYEHLKRTGVDRTVRCRVEIFPFAVEAENDDWPEKGQRDIRWVDPETAAGMVTAEGLAAKILAFGRARQSDRDTLPAAVPV